VKSSKLFVFSLFLFLSAGYGVGAEAKSGVKYSIPPDVMEKAKKDSNSNEGNAYENYMFRDGELEKLDNDLGTCTSRNTEKGWLTLVIKIEGDGKASAVYAEKDNLIYRCLAPRLKIKKYTRPPRAPFYKTMKIELFPAA
jgi:hypothetical protein